MSSTYSFRRCSWQLPTGSLDVCMFGGQCNEKTNLCSCPPGTLYDNVALHLTTCLPEGVLTFMLLHIILYVGVGMRMLYIIRERKLKKYFLRCAILGFLSCTSGIGVALSVYLERGAFYAWPLLAAFNGSSSDAIWANLWVAIVTPLYKTRSKSMDNVEKFARYATVSGFILFFISAIITSSFAGPDTPESFNISVLVMIFIAGVHMGSVTLAVQRHAKQLITVIQEDNQARASMGVSQNSDLQNVEYRVSRVLKLAKPAAANYFFLSILPALVYFISGTCPMLWLVTQATGFLPILAPCIIVDIISGRTKQISNAAVHTMDGTGGGNNNDASTRIVVSNSS
jgi:hypothetical protein